MTTPNFFINGRLIVGAANFEAFVKMIDEEIAAASARTATAVDG
jgi:protein-disulfide isomerase